MKVHDLETSVLPQVHLGKLRLGPSRGLRGAGPLVIFSALLGSSHESIHRAQAAPGGALPSSTVCVGYGLEPLFGSIRGDSFALGPGSGQWPDKSPHPEYGLGW